MPTSSTSPRTPWNRGKRLPPEPLTQAEVLALLGACSSRSATGLRNAALLVLLWRGGLRVGETLALEPKDIDPETHTVRILHGKGNKARTVGIDATAFAVLARWMDRRKQLGINGRAPVVCTLQGGGVLASYVRALLPRLACKAGIAKRVHPHGLRHTHSVELAREGIPITVISRQLGHSSVAVTNTYVNHLQPGEVIEAMKARSWELPKAG